MKVVVIFIVLFHAGIHIIGFAKAFQLAEIHQLTQSISKPIGIIWLFTAIMLLFSVVLLLLKKDWWFIVALIAAIISQLLIIMYWRDAKIGTIANIIVLMICLYSYSNFKFKNMVQKESEQLLQNIQLENLPRISKNDIAQLPEIIQKWIQRSGVLGKEKVVTVCIKQIGKMRTKPGSKWMDFRAIQHFNLQNPAFIWTTKVDAMPFIKLVGRDKLYNGKGEMLIKVASLIPVVNQGKNNKINQGAMIRFLAETCWFPSAALNNYINWETLNKTSAKATLTIAGKSVSGVFLFSNEGDLISFEANRYYGGENNATLEKWFVKINSYKTFNGIKIPNKSSVIWKLNDGDFKWLDLEIIDLQNNITNVSCKFETNFFF